MGLKQRLRLELEDGTEFTTAYDGRDIRAWEGHFNKGALGMRTTLSMLTFYGWSAGKRDGSLNGEYDKFEAFDKVCTWVEFLPEPTDELVTSDGTGEPRDPSEPPDPSLDTPREASDE